MHGLHTNIYVHCNNIVEIQELIVDSIINSSSERMAKMGLFSIDGRNEKDNWRMVYRRHPMLEEELKCWSESSACQDFGEGAVDV